MEAVLEVEAILIVGALALGYIVATDKLPAALSIKMQQPIVTTLIMIVLIIPVFIGVIFLHRYNQVMSYSLLALLGVTLPLMFSSWSRRLRVKSALLMAQTETMLEQLARGPGIKHPELDQAILSSRLTLARAKESINNRVRSNKRLIIEATTAASMVVAMHCVFVFFNGASFAQTLALPEILFRLTFVGGFIFIANKIIDKTKANPMGRN